MDVSRGHSEVVMELWWSTMIIIIDNKQLQ